MSKAAQKTLDVLHYVILSDQPVGLMDVSNNLEIDKTTASRLLNTLLEGHLLSKDTVTKKYRVGPGFLALSASTAKRAEILRVVHPYLENLRDLSGETTSFHLRVDKFRVCVDAVDRFPPQTNVRPLGIRSPLYRGTPGKVILAFLDNGEQAEILRWAEHHNENMEVMHAKLQSAKLTGYLSAQGELDSSLQAMSVALFQGTKVFGAITITGPAERWTPEKSHEFAPKLCETAATISTSVTNSRIYVYQNGESKLDKHQL